ncbi:MAG: CoA-binding protein [Sphingobacteriales bacterium]|jgi:predicted CoA-binding protein|nr:CoA-binding protein [Sphingobacteriales bacterium]MBP9141242.1 CoA-binding protein [Chitinophagales bacterium]MDA0197906.1 CoA-binding protein [Bacteroidota bacterium]MBK6890864.1 CoA-binding protein [Sphingobacteriales bacterium]MBK7526083.1 CoA-binding protein [Sphingobacteriales bacterium]
MSKPTIVLGASPNPERYAYKAALKLQQYGHAVIAIGKREGQMGAVTIMRQLPQLPLNPTIHTITLYLNAQNQTEFYPFILSVKPKRIIFNPGTENPELEKIALQNGIVPVIACTLVMLATGEF